MSFGTRARRWSARGGVAAVVLLASAGTQAAASAAQASGATAAVTAGAPAAADPYAPAYHHRYRHGAVPTRGTAARMASWARQHPSAAPASPAASPVASSRAAANAVGAASASNVRYGGGTGGIGVTTGDPKVYLVFYGSQWGAMSTNGNGDETFVNDTSGAAPYVQELFKGLGTGGELWSGTMTQYCQGVKAGTQACPATARHVAYPHGGALAPNGVWYDNSGPSPTQATGLQLAQEAAAAATHFGNTTAASNRDAQYIIMSPPGADPDGYLEAGFCAWHDYTGDTTLGGVVSPGYIAFTNMPYVTDAGQGCGENFVNSGSAGLRDGFSIVVGHEYAETITDQEPPGGWIDPQQNENADKCAWRKTDTGHAALLNLSTGTFAMQGTWSNNARSGQGGCWFTGPAVPTQVLGNAGFETGRLSPWTATSGVLKKKSSTLPAQAGNWLARLGGRPAPHTDTLSQKVTVEPQFGSYGAATLAFWLEIKTNDPPGTAHDRLTVQVLTTGGTVLTTLATFSNLNAVSHYVRHSFALSPSIYHGQTIVIKFTGTETLAGHSTSFLVDSAALTGS